MGTCLSIDWLNKQNRHPTPLVLIDAERGGYGWQGHVEGRGQENRQFVAYLNILPLEYDEIDEPEWYIAIVDDLTESHKSVVEEFDRVFSELSDE